MLHGKKIIVLGDESGISSRIIVQALADSGAEVAYAATECFV